MKILTKKLEITADELEKISHAQDRAFEMVKKHLAEPIKKIEAMGYSRLELACAYLSPSRTIPFALKERRNKRKRILCRSHI